MNISKEILIKAQEGDLKSFEVIYRDTASFVYNVAFRVTGNRQDAEEVTQEVFLNIHHNLSNFRFESSFKTWAYRIAVNTAINYSKKMSREKERRRDYGENLARLGQTFSKPEVETGDQERQEVISSLLEGLNYDQRACVVLRNIEGLSYREIADTLKININTVRTRLKRAREKLMTFRKEVEKNGL